MIQCPKCKEYNVEFDSYFKRPRCYECGWLPSSTIHSLEFKLQTMNGAFEPCNKCWGYPELRSEYNCTIDGQKTYYCDKCRNKGKVLNSLGREVVEIVQEIIEDHLVIQHED